MARKSAAAAQIEILINAKQLNTLLGHNRRLAKQTAELTGELREKIAYAVDKMGLHKKAFATLKSIDKMEPEAALEILDALAGLSGHGRRDQAHGIGHAA